MVAALLTGRLLVVVPNLVAKELSFLSVSDHCYLLRNKETKPSHSRTRKQYTTHVIRLILCGLNRICRSLLWWSRLTLDWQASGGLTQSRRGRAQLREFVTYCLRMRQC